VVPALEEVAQAEAWDDKTVTGAASDFYTSRLIQASEK
jgi:hypothetical protein